LLGDYNIYHKYKLYFINQQKFLLKEDFKFEENYLFLPLQLPYDSQMVFNSKYDNLDAIKIAKEMADSNNLELVVKPHPLNLNMNYLNLLEKIRSEIPFKISYENTTKLVLQADELVTINSTVGLEGLIFNKKVIFLGKSFYAKLTHEYLKNYILSYLIGVSSKQAYDKNFAINILSRIFLSEKI